MRGAPLARGFVLAELILVVALSAVVVVALLGTLVAVVRVLQPPAVRVGGELLPIAPTFGCFPSAVRLHQILADRFSGARAVYVLGGRHVSIPADSAAAAVRPLKLQALPVISDFARGLPMDAKGFYDLYASDLGEQDLSARPEDFSVVLIGIAGGRLAVTSFVQVRSSDRPVSDGTETTIYRVREARLWDQEAGLQRYAFAEAPARNAGAFTGAVHTWMRYRSGTTAEEGPTCVVFPDPWIYGGTRATVGAPPPFSRFSYFVAVSP